MATLQEAIAALGPEFSRLPQNVQDAALANFDKVLSSTTRPGYWAGATQMQNYLSGGLPAGYATLQRVDFSGDGQKSGHYLSDPSKVQWNDRYGLIAPTWQGDPTAWTDLGYPDEWQLTDPGVAAAIAAAGFGIGSGLNALLGPGITGAGGAGAAGVGAATTGAGATGAGLSDAAMWAGIGGADAASGVGALGFTGEGLGALGAAGAAGSGAGSALTRLGPVLSQAGTTFNTTMPWYAQLAEAQTLGGAGLTAAEMGSLGVSPWAAQIGAQSWLPQITGPSKSGGGLLGNLSKLPTSALNGQLGGGQIGGVTGDSTGGPEFTPAPSNMSPMWGGQPNYQAFENVAYDRNNPTLLDRLGRIRNG